MKINTYHLLTMIVRSGGHGTRHPLESSGITDRPETGDAESGALAEGRLDQGDSQSPNEIDDPELATIVAAWPSLPPAIRADITALVQSAGGGDA